MLINNLEHCMLLLFTGSNVLASNKAFSAITNRVDFKKSDWILICKHFDYQCRHASFVIYLFVYLFIYLFVYLFIYLFVYLFIYLFISSLIYLGKSYTIVNRNNPIYNFHVVSNQS